MGVVVLRSMSFVMTPPAASKPVNKGVTSRSGESCACEDPSPVVAELSALPEPAPKAPERAHVLHRSRRKRPHPPTLSHDPRKCARTQDKPTDSDATPAENAQSTGGSKSNFPPHGALGGFALTTATLLASTPTSTSGVGRLGDGGRGATKRRGEAVCVKESVPFVIGVGRRLRGTGGLRCSEQRDTKAQPLGHQGGKPPWAAVANAQSRRGNQERRWTGTATHQKTTGQTHERQQTENQAQEEGPQRGLDVQIQVGREICHGPAGADLPCTASPDLQRDA